MRTVLSMLLYILSLSCLMRQPVLAQHRKRVTPNERGGDVAVASLRRLSAAVALSSPPAETQILSRNSLPGV